MPKPRINPKRRLLPDTVRRRLEVATAMAWESVVEMHIAHARQFIQLLAERLPLEDALARYLRGMDLSGSIWTSVSTRVLVGIESGGSDATAASIPLPADGRGGDHGWRRFRPDVVVKDMITRQRTADDTERWVALLMARAEEGLILAHVDNAITFAALLDAYMPLAKAVQLYIDAVSLSGGRAQSVFQRTMARLADANLPVPAPKPELPPEPQLSR